MFETFSYFGESSRGKEAASGLCIRAAFSGEREFRRVVCKKCFQVVLRDVDGSLENHESLYAQIKEQVKRRLRETHNINIKSMLIGSKS